jgi:uncharacterized oligopeptide transporter (OPT) family protein
MQDDPSPSHPTPATAPRPDSQEAIELEWYRNVYQGDSQPQLTVRAVLMGGFLGMLMSISNLYTTLKLGWSFSVAITACVMSYLIWNGMRFISGNRLTPMSLLENNCMQSTASAAGYSTGSTVGTAFGALLLLEGVHQPWYVLLAMVFLTASLGVFLAIPMKRQMINREQLKFPSGFAAAETLRSLYSKGQEAVHKAWALVAGLAVGGGIGLLRSYGQVSEQLRNVGRPQVWLETMVKWLHIPETLAFPAFLSPLARGSMAGLSFEPSVLLIGAGMITGARVCLSMLGGSILLYYFVAPALINFDLAHDGVAGYVRSIPVNGRGVFMPTRWALWGGSAVMVFASLLSLALQWRTIGRALRSFRRSGRSGEADPLARIEVPGSWLVMGLIPIGIGLVIVQNLAFHVSIPLGIIAVVFSFVTALVCCRATGETDTTPIGAVGKVTQLLYAALPGAQGVASINLMAAGTTASAGSSSADLLTDLKSGYLLGANPRRQFIAQWIGIFFGSISIVPAWYAMVPDKAALENFNPPMTLMWKAVADLLTQGLNHLPQSAIGAILIGAVIGTLIPLLEYLKPAWRPYLPSTMGLGLAWVISFENCFSFAIGAVIVWVWQRWRSRNCELFSIPLACGFVAGESLVAAILAIACTAIGFWVAK